MMIALTQKIIFYYLGNKIKILQLDLLLTLAVSLQKQKTEVVYERKGSIVV